MRDLERDKRTVWYALYIGKVPIEKTSGGVKTGEYSKSYATPVCVQLNYSAGSDSLTIGEAGIQETYDRTMTTANTDCPITEGTRIWIGIAPVTGETNNPHNYVVARREDSPRGIKYGLKKVKVS